MKERKTLWSVDYTGIGYERIHRRYFETKSEAEEFSNRDYHDNPVRRTYTKENADKIIKEQKRCDKLDEMGY